eukprot:TRINITY_DN75088_c0_g1_i1.p1 TRINITY_DN75088_c0_g1~~TRINITY_DN75088_c0_g1_i1.p1  ORF type:complete len:339 (+),score=66.76 TRINITY_DN75088_c0_g1_i1:59-1075(+)
MVSIQVSNCHMSVDTPVLLGSPSNRRLTTGFNFSSKSTSRSIAASWHIPASKKADVDRRPDEVPPPVSSGDLIPAADDDAEAALEVVRRQCLALLSKVESSQDDLQRFEQRRYGRVKLEDAEVQSQQSEDPRPRQEKLDNESLDSALVPERPAQEDFRPAHKDPCPETVLASPLPGSVATERDDENLRDELLLLLRSPHQASKKPNHRPEVALSRRYSEPRLQSSGAKLKLGQTTRLQILEEAALEQAKLEERRRHSAPASPNEAWSGIQVPRYDDSVMAKVWSFITPHWLKEDYVRRNASGLRRRSQLLKARHRQEHDQLFHASSGHLTRRIASSDR